MKKIGIVLILVGVGIIAWTLYQRPAEAPQETADEVMTIEDKMKKEEPSEDEGMKEVDSVMALEMMEKNYSIEGKLFDVTGSEIIYGIETGGAASGVAKAGYEDGSYHLIATFENIPDPINENRYFYEGWVVRRGADFSVISTGKVNKEEGGYVNLYTSETNLLDHDFYVLTLEPNDGDPAPDEHIVEGTMTPIN